MTDESDQPAAATEAAWIAIEHEFGLLTADQVAAQAGPDAPGPLLSVDRPEGLRFPGFQLGDTGPLEVFTGLRAPAADLDMDPETVLLWMTGPTTWWVEQDRPVDHADDPESVIEVFGSHFGVNW